MERGHAGTSAWPPWPGPVTCPGYFEERRREWSCGSPRERGALATIPSSGTGISGKSFAQLTPAEKNARSHRGNAFRALARYLAGNPTHPAHVGPTADGSALGIHWGDGEEAVYRPFDLRMACPCAGCVDEMTGRPLLDASSVPESVFPVRIQHVGRYALQFFWSDGHDTGLYTYPYLRELWERSLRGDGDSG